MFDNEKIKLIESLPAGDSLLIVWIKLLTLAGKTNAGGYIYMNENIPYTKEMLATAFGRKLNIVALALKTFSEFGMIEIEKDAKIFIKNWEKHQNVDGLEKIRQQGRDRQKRHREKAKEITLRNVTQTLRVTECNAPDKEEEREKEYNNAQCADDFENFWSLYGKKRDRKRCMQRWKKLKQSDKDKIFETLPAYIASTPDVQFRKNPSTYLNNESWNDEITISQQSQPPKILTDEVRCT